MSAVIRTPPSTPAPAIAAAPKPRRRFSLQKFWASLTGTPLTEDERRELRNKKAEAERLKNKDALLKNECEQVSNEISWALADLGICFKKEERRHTRITRVRFTGKWTYSEEALYLPVDLSPRKRPAGVRVDQLADEGTLRDLSITVGRKVEARYTERIGFVYVVWRDQSARGIPDHVKYDDMIALRPASAGALSFPLGMGEGKSRHWHNFAKGHAVGIYGQSGGGKSNLINVIISTLVSQCSPNFMKLALIDMKRVELNLFRKLPHVWQFTDPKTNAKRAGYVYEAEDAASLLETIIDEIDRRYKLLEKEEVRNIGEYNARHKARALPYIFVVIDEFADMASDAAFGKRFHKAMERIVRIGRAAGICTMLCTQHPNKEVLSMGIRVNLPTTLAFSVSNLNASVSVIGSKNAYGLSSKPGRYIYKAGPLEREIQAPMISTDKVKEVLALVMGGKRYHADLNAGHDVSDQEIFEWAIAKNDGYLSRNAITKQFENRGMTPRSAQTFIEHYQNQTVVVEGTEYLVRHGGKGVTTRLVALNVDSQAGQGDAQSEGENSQGKPA